MIRHLACLGCAALLAAAPAAVSAGTGDPSPASTASQTRDSRPPSDQGFGLTGDWGGLRTRLADRGIEIDASFEGDFAANVSGGERHDATQSSGFALGTTIDMGKFAGLDGGTFDMVLTKRFGPNLVTRAGLGTLQAPQAIYARGQTYRLTDMWYRQKLGAITDLTVGRLNMGEDFGVLPCDFENLTVCGSPIGNLVGDYWYNSPISQWAGLLRVRPGAFTLMVGIYEYNPNNLKKGIALSYGGAKGVTVPIELAWRPHVGSHGLPGLYRIGAWYNSGHGDDVLTGEGGRPFAVTGLDPISRSGRYGGYLMLQQQLTGSFVETADGARATHGLVAYLNFTHTDRRTARLDSQLAVWLTYVGLLAARPQDDVGIAIGRTGVNSRAALSEVLATFGSERPKGEYATELSYGIHVRSWMTLHPNVQYIVHPGGYADKTDIVILGLKSGLTF